MKPLYPDDYWEVNIEWSKPASYERIRTEGSKLDCDAYFYMIMAKYSTGKYKSIYVGKTYQQTVSVRLNQLDHKKRYAAFNKNYPNHRFYISCGMVALENGKLTRKRISDIESILIYSNDPREAHNVQNFYGHGVSGSYEINNHGYRCTLPKVISLGVFYK